MSDYEPSVTDAETPVVDPVVKLEVSDTMLEPDGTYVDPNECKISFSDSNEVYEVPDEDRVSDDIREKILQHGRTMENAWIVLKVQGYRTPEGIFIIKELGVYDGETKDSLVFKPPESIVLKRGSELYNRRYTHRIPYKYGLYPYDTIRAKLRKLCKGKIVYVKGRDQCSILAGYGVQSEDLEYFDCPKADQLPSVNVSCHILNHQYNNFCAELRVRKFGMFFESK